MTKKPKGTTIIEDVSNILFSYPCPHCGEKNQKRGRWFQANDHFICESCAMLVPLPYEQIVRMFDQHVDQFRKAFERMETQTSKKLD